MGVPIRLFLLKWTENHFRNRQNMMYVRAPALNQTFHLITEGFQIEKKGVFDQSVKGSLTQTRFRVLEIDNIEINCPHLSQVL